MFLFIESESTNFFAGDFPEDWLVYYSSKYYINFIGIFYHIFSYNCRTIFLDSFFNIAFCPTDSIFHFY